MDTTSNGTHGDSGVRTFGARERQRILLEINNALVAQLHQKPLFCAVAGCIRRLLPFDRASLALIDHERGVFRIHALEAEHASRELPVGAEYPRHGSRAGIVADAQRGMSVPDLALAKPLCIEDGHLLRAGMRSRVLVPLRTGRGAIGVIGLASRELNFYKQPDLDLLTGIAQQVALAVDNMLAYKEISELKGRLEDENHSLHAQIRARRGRDAIVGNSAPIRRMLSEIGAVACAQASVLIMGETGTGKELVARAIHDGGRRPDAPFVGVNCSAIPLGLIESELFGHEKGAFTGAHCRRVGRFELAHGGTLFLDEVAELPLNMQAKLLRVVQEREFERVGGSETIGVDTRIVAATNRLNLEEMAREGNFRADLFYRLSVVPLYVPPLRERPGDIALLALHFAKKHGRRVGKRIDGLDPVTLEALQAHSWPGNVRELENVVERAVILTTGDELSLRSWRPRAWRPVSCAGVTLEEVSRRHILESLRQTGWRVSGAQGAARLLGLKPTTLEAKMKKLGIRRPHARGVIPK